MSKELELQIQKLTKELEAAKSANVNQLKEMALVALLAGKPLPKNGISPEANLLTAKVLMEEAMRKDGIVLNFDSGYPILKQKRDEIEMDYFFDNKKVTLETYVDSVLAESKFLQVNEPQPAGHGNNSRSSFHPNYANGGNATVVAEVDALLAQLD